MKKYYKYFIMAGIFLGFNLLISILYFFTGISYNSISNILFIFYLIFFGLISFDISKNTKKKGIISGLIVGSIITVLLVLLSLIFKSGISINSIIYYLLIILSSIFGAILSKNVKK